jgi:hypothetical protein
MPQEIMLEAFKILFQRYCNHASQYSSTTHLHCRQAKTPQVDQNNVFVDYRGFPDESEYYDSLLHKINRGLILCKQKHPPPSFNEVDPASFCTYNKSTHSAQLRKDLNLSNLYPNVRDQFFALVQKYCSVFDKKGIFVPV